VHIGEQVRSRAAVLLADRQPQQVRLAEEWRDPVVPSPRQVALLLVGAQLAAGAIDLMQEGALFVGHLSILSSHGIARVPSQRCGPAKT
jgi:hypothetical protein